MRAMAVVYPLAVFPAIVSGLLDGKLRFKKIFTPLLIRKLILAFFVLVITSIISIVSFTTINFSGIIHYIAGATVVSLFFQGTLARMGIRMVNCMMPGK
jgi:hypothetical protein